MYIADIDNERLDVFVARTLDISRTLAAASCEEGHVRVDGVTRNKNYKLKLEQNVEIDVQEAVPLDIEAQDIELDIAFEDEYLLVVNKARGMVTHPAPGNYSGTLVNALMHHCKDSLSGINGVMRPGIVHRLDKDTSGLLIVAKNDLAHRELAAQIKEHSFLREYEALVVGSFKVDEGTVDKPIARHPDRRKEMAIVEGGREAITHYKVLCDFGGVSHLRLKLETGRTHQIRVHMKSISHPVLGDVVYGGKNADRSLGGQILHAKMIEFTHPKTKERLRFESELPTYFTQILDKYKR